MSSVHAVVVTHNRSQLLGECLAAVEAQRRRPDRVLVVDNASTDDTRDLLACEFPQADVLALPVNVGGAGGFHEGIARAYADGAEWLWLMDDDTVPAPDALSELLETPARTGLRPPPSVLVSRVVWLDGRLHPMNAPWPDRRRIDLLIEAAARGLVPLREATFVSLLLHRRAVERHGLPLKHFFIWSDDIEYTSRLVLRGEVGYLVPTSVAHHKTPTAHTAASATAERFYYHVRNSLFIIRGPGRSGRERTARAWRLTASVGAYLRANPRLSSARAITRGLRDGLGRAPRRQAAG